MIDQEIDELIKKYKLDDQQAAAVRSAMANYALAAIMDTKIAKEAETICNEENLK